MTLSASVIQALAALATTAFRGQVFRATPVSADPLAPSVRGGRWAPPKRAGSKTSVLYTSLDRNGALAEVCSYLVLLAPLPSVRLLKLSRLETSTSRTLRLARADLATLGVDLTRYGERDYARTQEIGEACVALGLDGLIAPSARWPCDNLMIFTENLAPDERLQVVDSEEVEWRAWAMANGLLAA
jgi:RES domain-containing protein